jgi:RNA polymerase sigma factor (TIGR02999 family)
MTAPIEDERDEAARGPESPAPAAPKPARELLPQVYDELRRLAAQRMARETPGQTLQATALVHEAYLRLVGVDPDRPWDGRGHFFAAAAEAMRRILVENARRRHRLKRGGNCGRVDLDAAQPAAPETDDDLLALDEALEKLAAKDPAKAQLVQLRVFAGLTLAESAEILGLSTSTADRYWAYARAWLRVEIAGADAPGPGPTSPPAGEA